MTDYPEWLVDRVASVILDNFNPPDDGHSSWWINPEKSAVAVLDALEFQERTARGILINGKYVGYASPYLQRDTIKTYTRWTAATEWHEEES